MHQSVQDGRMVKRTDKKTHIKGAKNKKKIRTATAPGQVVSVDQIVIPTPGFIPNHRGRPMAQRYVDETIFVDNFSDFIHFHLI